MLRLWNRSLHLSVGARDVHAALHPSWLRRKGGALASHAVETPGTTHTIAGTPLTEPHARAIEAVLSDIGAAASTRKACLSVALTDARVHFDVVNGDYGGYSDRQLQAIANACVTELLGDAALSQVVRWQLQPDLHHLLICAMDRQDVETVVQAAARHGLRLCSLQPEFCLKWNQHAAALPDGSGVFAVTSDEHVIVVCAMHGAITALSCGPWAPHGPAPQDQRPEKSALDARVDRLLASVGLDAGNITSFMLVTRNPVMLDLPSRWTFVDYQEEAA